MNSVAIQTVAVKDSSPPAKPAPVADSNALTFFLRGARRPSTIAFGKWVWAKLSAYPEGAPLNLSEAARELGLSRPTLYRSLRFFTRFGRLLPVEGYAVGTHQPGRPRAYRLHPSFFADGKRDSAKRVNLSSTSPRKTKNEKSSHPDIHRRPLEVELSQLKRPVSEKGRRWALAKIRESLKASGTPYRRKIMAAIAPPLTRAIKKNRIRDGYELNRVVRRIADMLDEGEFRASRLCDKAIAARFTGTWRPLYAAASALVARAVAEVERDRRELEKTEALLEQYRKDWEEWHREEMRRELELREWLGEEVQFPKKLSPKEEPPTCPEVGWPDEPNWGFPEQSPATKQPPMAKRSSVEERSLITEGLEAARRTLAVGAVSEDPAAELTLSPHRAEIEGEAFGPACSGFVWSGGGSTEGYWVLGGRKRATRAQPKRVTREERVRQLREEARCGDPEREALARAILRRLRSKVAI